ncbi:9558_t:CDS:2 [Acaulospora colombiana]|uniref:9558_t:CDS:1 n=1 Tax=Acaulospora colombiana TaxID=27376 RepID=A0ACA9P3B9_9GLOM|nr:9558_t:CDS:2 [Acaulospora colombiana]
MKKEHLVRQKKTRNAHVEALTYAGTSDKAYFPTQISASCRDHQLARRILLGSGVQDDIAYANERLYGTSASASDGKREENQAVKCQTTQRHLDQSLARRPLPNAIDRDIVDVKNAEIEEVHVPGHGIRPHLTSNFSEGGIQEVSTSNADLEEQASYGYSTAVSASQDPYSLKRGLKTNDEMASLKKSKKKKAEEFYEKQNVLIGDMLRPLEEHVENAKEAERKNRLPCSRLSSLAPSPCSPPPATPSLTQRATSSYGGSTANLPVSTSTHGQ